MRARVRAEGLQFAIIAMGRLGGSEMSYSSDADVLFVYEPASDMPEARERSLMEAPSYPFSQNTPVAWSRTLPRRC